MTKEIDKVVEEIGRDNGEYFTERVRAMDSAIDLTMDTGKRGQSIDVAHKKTPTPVKITGDRGDLL